MEKKFRSLQDVEAAYQAGSLSLSRRQYGALQRALEQQRRREWGVEGDVAGLESAVKHLGRKTRQVFTILPPRTRNPSRGPTCTQVRVVAWPNPIPVPPCAGGRPVSSP